jgi:hypothetical protein
MMYAVSSFVASTFGVAILAVLAAVLVLAFVSLPYWTGALRVRFDNFPPWSIYRLMVGSVWLFTVATLLKANTALDQVFRDMLDSGVLRPWLRERVRRMRDHYQSEANFGKLLLSLNMNFPDQELVEDLAVYAAMPNFSREMYSIARQWLDEGVERIAAQAQIVNSILILCIIVIMCGIGLAGGSMQEQLQNMGSM